MAKQISDLIARADQLAAQDPTPEILDWQQSIRIQIEALTREFQALADRLKQPD